MRKVIFGILILIALLLTIRLLVNPLANSVINKKLNTVVGNNIHIESSNSFFNAFTGDLVIEDLTIFQKEDTLNEPPNFKLNIDDIQVFSVDIVSFISSGKLICDSILLETPELDFKSFIKDSVENSKLLNGLLVKKIKVNNASAKFISGNELQFDSLNFELDNLDLPLDSLFSLSNIAYNQFTCNVRNLVYSHPKEMYEYKTEFITLSSLNKWVGIENLMVIPRYSKNQFAKVLGREAARVSLHVPKINLYGFDFESLLLHDTLLMRKALVDNYYLHVFKDKRLARPANMPNQLYPNELIRHLKLPIKIDTLACQSGTILFEGWPMGAKRPGSIELSKANILITDICNIPDELNYLNSIKIDFYAVLAQEGKLKAHFSLPLDNLKSPMVYSGTLSKMNLKKFNSILEPFLNMKIRRGTLNALSFNVAAYRNKAVGDLVMNYKGLKVSVGSINNRALIENTSLESIVNMLVNSFLIKKDNPSRRKPIREGQIYFKPDRSRFVVHYWLNSIFSGIPESLGMPRQVSGKLRK